MRVCKKKTIISYGMYYILKEYRLYVVTDDDDSIFLGH